MTVFTFFHSTI